MDKTLQDRLQDALRGLAEQGHRPMNLERTLGLSRGYLSTCRPGSKTMRTPGKFLVITLELLAKYPQELKG